jgi:hypothetical protein
MLELAGELAARFRLIALWDGKDPDRKPGGTAALVGLARHANGEFVHIDMAQLLRKFWP